LGGRAALVNRFFIPNVPRRVENPRPLPPAKWENAGITGLDPFAADSA
jgi:hypothetical protein